MTTTTAASSNSKESQSSPFESTGSTCRRTKKNMVVEVALHQGSATEYKDQGTKGTGTVPKTTTKKCFLLETIPLQVRFLIYDHIIHDRTIYKPIPASIQQKGYKCDNNPTQEQARRIKINKWLPCSPRRKNRNYLSNTLGVLSQTCTQHRHEILKIWYKAKPWLRRSTSPGVGIFDPQTTEFYFLIGRDNPFTVDSKLGQRFCNFFGDKFLATQMRHLRIDLDVPTWDLGENSKESMDIFINKTAVLKDALEIALKPRSQISKPSGSFEHSLLQHETESRKERHERIRKGEDDKLHARYLDSFDFDIVSCRSDYVPTSKRRVLQPIYDISQIHGYKDYMLRGTPLLPPRDKSEDDSDDDSDDESEVDGGNDPGNRGEQEPENHSGFDLYNESEKMTEAIILVQSSR